jgi:hypothetical protein
LITNGASAALDDGTEASDHRGEKEEALASRHRSSGWAVPRRIHADPLVVLPWRIWERNLDGVQESGSV